MTEIPKLGQAGPYIGRTWFWARSSGESLGADLVQVQKVPGFIGLRWCTWLTFWSHNDVDHQMVSSPGEYKLENADNGKTDQQHWHIILFKVKWPSVQKIFTFCLDLWSSRVSNWRLQGKRKRRGQINSIISPSLPSAVLPCFLPVLSHQSDYVFQLKCWIMKLLPDVNLQLSAFSSYPSLNCLFFRLL